MAHAIVTGGSGYVGTHLIQHLLQEGPFEAIINVDLQSPKLKPADSRQLHYVQADVREPLEPGIFKKFGCGPDTVIFNLAAICKIPGYPTIDYFKTNIKGAETVCSLAEKLGAKTIAFTSSIAPYGTSEELKAEQSIPQPDNAYGSSKLVAEYIHRGWQQKCKDERNLVILRPGIIFGKNEQANFVRLYKAMEKGYFVYPGRKDTRKACVYVKDVARACLHFSLNANGFQLYNIGYKNAPTIEAICDEISRVTNVHSPVFTISGKVLKGVAYCLTAGRELTGQNFAGIHPDRVQKLMISTNISCKKLADSPFTLRYSLHDGIEEWFRECEDGLC